MINRNNNNINTDLNSNVGNTNRCCYACGMSKANKSSRDNIVTGYAYNQSFNYLSRMQFNLIITISLQQIFKTSK